jgi:putative secreted protein
MDRQIRKKKILSILFSLCILLVFVSCNSASSNKESLNEKSRVEHIEGDFAIDVDSPYELVGFSDYYFNCEVISQKDTEYKDPITIETEHGVEEITSPYTNYEIKVKKI